MELIFNFLRSDTFLLMLLGGFLILLILYVSTVVKLGKLRKSYVSFMKKLGSGDQLDEIMKQYIRNVEDIKAKNEEIISYCKRLDDHIGKCTQKIGVVRYNAFRDTGSDLSFTLAMLNEYNDGVVLNGIYARDMSNIYAKPIEGGKSKYVLSDEEKEAIEKAIHS